MSRKFNVEGDEFISRLTYTFFSAILKDSTCVQCGIRKCSCFLSSYFVFEFPRVMDYCISVFFLKFATSAPLPSSAILLRSNKHPILPKQKRTLVCFVFSSLFIITSKANFVKWPFSRNTFINCRNYFISCEALSTGDFFTFLGGAIYLAFHLEFYVSPPYSTLKHLQFLRK